MDDHDVPKSLIPSGVYDHWVVYNIKPHISKISENSLPFGIEGKNTSGKIGYIGPCPPDKEHKYSIRLYALDTILDLPSGKTKSEVLQAMDGHIIEECLLVGRYEKGRGY